MLYVGERGGYKNFGFFLSSAAPLMKAEQLFILSASVPVPLPGRRKGLMDRLGVRDKVHHIMSRRPANWRACITLHRLSAIHHSTKALECPFWRLFHAGAPLLQVQYLLFRKWLPTRRSILIQRTLHPCGLQSKELSLILKRSRELVRRGRERMKLFSWERAAKATLEVYRGSGLTETCACTS